MLNLERQFTFYASYHDHPVNVLIHLVCIWPILATTLLLLQYTPAVADTPTEWLATNLPHVKLNAAFLLSLVYVVCYVIMEPVVGGVAAMLVIALLVQSAHLVGTGATLQGWPVWQVALAIHVGCWLLQFIGHGFFEKRAPALLDSLDQALLTAPLFVLLEIFFFLGYRRRFHDQLMITVRSNIRKFRSAKKK